MNKNIFKLYENNNNNNNNVNKKEKENKYHFKNILDTDTDNNIFDYNNEKDTLSKRNNLNHTNDNIYESKMFSVDNSNDNVIIKDNNNKRKRSSATDNICKKNFDVSSIHSDWFLSVDKSNKSFSVNNGFYNKKRKNKNNGYTIKSNNQSFYSVNVDNKMKNRKGCFLLFEKSSVNKLKEKIENLNKYTTSVIDTMEIKDI